MTQRRHNPDHVIRKLAKGNKLRAGALDSTRSADISKSPLHLGPLDERRMAT
jgi:hypothetical protein